MSKLIRYGLQKIYFNLKIVVKHNNCYINFIQMLKLAFRTLKNRSLPQRTLISKYCFSEPKKPFIVNTVNQLTTNQYVSKNVGVQRFLQKVYKTTGLTILGALGTSYGVLSLPISAAGVAMLAKCGIGAGLVGVIGSSLMKPEIMTVSEQLNSKEKVELLVSRNSMLRKVLYGAGVIGIGLSTAPMIGIVNAINPTILPLALGLTAALFGGASLAAYRMPKDSMLSYGRILGGSLLGLVGLQLIGLGSLFFFGMNPFATMLLNTSTYISLGLFTAFIAYDTHVAIRMYEQKMPDHLGMATNFFLNFWNILVDLLRIFSSE